MDNKIIEAILIADRIMGDYLAVQKHEEVLICVDPETDVRMTNAMAAAAQKYGKDYVVVMIPIRDKTTATTIPKTLEKAMEGCDVYVGMTRASGASVYNRKMKELLIEKKIRESSMVLRDIDNYIKGGALADYNAIYEEGKRLADIWRGKKAFSLTTPAGTHLTADMNIMEPIIECGIAREPGQSMAFSDGEVSLGPVEGTMNGVLVIDGPLCYYGLPQKPIKLKIRNGRVSEILDGDPRIIKELESLFATVENSDNIAEIGIGLNPTSLFNGDFEEEKKARGTVHLALGNGIYYGQTIDSQVHIDVVLYSPTVTFDDQLIVKDGKVIVLD
ncbi:leucyl aminopeptidase [Acidaminobacter sp. JC074]|uniref:aminopeptidase n=1 Tax=Acidaminobacter sp. JC074 TaxID=2530199 RepID=UPI001F0F300D|nr:aminopeptidase [Acidaminobacter sp. JC074]MCH4889020.1 leucyl aminopeptidase [Acidaminobacter sp. JC074]